MGYIQFRYIYNCKWRYLCKNGDGTITVHGTATNGDSTYIIIPGSKLRDSIPTGDYIVSGVPDGASSTTYFIHCYKHTSTTNTQIYKDTKIHCDYTTHGTGNIAIIVRNGTTVNNLVFKPMLRNANINDPTFVPYIPTNAKLNSMLINTLSAPYLLLDNINRTYTDTNGVREFSFTIPNVSSYQLFVVTFSFASPYSASFTATLMLGPDFVGRSACTTVGPNSLLNTTQYSLYMRDTGALVISYPLKILSWESATPQIIDNPSLSTTCHAYVYGMGTTV